jgi:hypothetical protein
MLLTGHGVRFIGNPIWKKYNFNILPDELLRERRLLNTLNRRSVGTENILILQLLINIRVVTQAAIYTMKFNPQGTAIASGSHDREICKFHISLSFGYRLSFGWDT